MPAYNELYLEGVENVTRLVFTCLVDSEYDFFDAVDAYMQTSEIRKKMDIGNSSALMKGHLQILHSIDFSGCKPNTENEENIDSILYHFMADIYVYLQWKYSLSSKEINEKVPARELARIFYPLHETSIAVACRKICHKYRLGENKDED